MPKDTCDLLCLDLERAEALRAHRIDPAMANEGSIRAKALSDPTRLVIAHSLIEGELCVCDLAWVSERSEALVSHHVRALRNAGLVSSRRDKKMVLYSLTDSGRSLLSAVLPANAMVP